MAEPYDQDRDRGRPHGELRIVVRHSGSRREVFRDEGEYVEWVRATRVHHTVQRLGVVDGDEQGWWK